MKKVIRLTESDLVRIVKKVLKEDYTSKNPDMKIKKLDWNNTSNEIVVSSNGKNYAYKIIYTELNPFSSCKTEEDNCKVNFKDIGQEGNNLIINRWVEGGKTEKINISFEDLKNLSTGSKLIKSTGIGKVIVIPTSSW